MHVSLDNPVLGVGLGAYPAANEVYARSLPGVGERAKRRLDAHSTYLTVLAENGVLGLTLFLLFVYSALRKVNLVRRKVANSLPGVSQQLRFLIAGYTGFLVAAVVGTYSTMAMTYVHLFAIWALATTALDSETASTNPADAKV